MTTWSVGALLPGLCVALLCALITYWVSRLYDRVPLRAAALFSLMIALLFGKALFTGEILLPLDNLRGEVPFAELAPSEPVGNLAQSDLLRLTAPARSEVRRALLQGRWPLWNPHSGAGTPLLADPQSEALQPFTLAATAFPVSHGAAVTAALKIYWTLLFTFLFLRRQQLEEGPALAGALAWGLGGFLLLWLGWPISNSAAWLPAVLYALTRVGDFGSARDGALLTLALTGLLLGGHPETILYALILAVGFWWVRLRADINQEQRRDRLQRSVVALATACCLAAPALLATAAYAPQSLRASRLVAGAESPAAELTAGTRASQRLLPLVAPNAFGNDRYVHYWGWSNINEDASGFVGIVTLLLALAGVRSFRRTRELGTFPQERFFQFVAAVCLVVLALPPGLFQLAQWLPGGAISDFHHRLLFPLGFSLALLAAYELERLCRGLGGSRTVTTLLAVGLAALLAWGYLGHRAAGDPALLEVFRFGWLRWHLRFLALALVLIWLLRGRRVLAPALGVLIAAELFLIHGPANPSMPQRLDFPQTPPIRFLANQEKGSRIVGLGNTLPPNVASIYGLFDGRIYNPMAPKEVLEAASPVIVDWQGDAPIYGHPEDYFYDQLGVRFVLAPAGEQLPRPLELIFRSSSGWVWERPGSPKIFRLDDPLENGSGAASGLEVHFDHGGRIELQVARAETSVQPEAPVSPRSLSTGLYQDGGWHLLADGRPVASRRNGPFLTAWLRGDEKQLVLIYRPWSWILGCLLAGLGLATGLARWLPPPGDRL